MHRRRLAGVISVDGTCRPQFVADDDARRVRRAAAAKRAGDGASAPCSTRASTSTASRSSARRREAVDVFLRSGADALAIGPFLVARGQHDGRLSRRRAVVPPARGSPGRRRSPRRQPGGIAARSGCSARRRADAARAAEDRCSSGRSMSACSSGCVAGVCVAARPWRARLDRRDVPPHGRCWRRSALALTLFVAPRTNRIFYDEQIYQGIGQNLADLRLAQMCNDGSVEYGRLQCASGEYNKQPYAYPACAEPGLSAVWRARAGRPSP